MEKSETPTSDRGDLYEFNNIMKKFRYRKLRIFATVYIRNEKYLISFITDGITTGMFGITTDTLDIEYLFSILDDKKCNTYMYPYNPLIWNSHIKNFDINDTFIDVIDSLYERNRRLLVILDIYGVDEVCKIIDRYIGVEIPNFIGRTEDLDFW